jgi:hydroxymethylglutaryl-CoA lyase
MGQPIDIVDVSPRDGLQNEAALLPTASKLALIRRLAAAGVRRIEVASFVNPERVPQMADAEAVVAELPAGIEGIGLVLNVRGVERALATAVPALNFTIAATDAFAVRNQGKPVAALLDQWAEAAGLAHRTGRPIAIVISTVFGCPFEGEVPVARIAEVVAAVARARPAVITLADTIGAAAPSDVRAKIEAARAAAPDIPLACHFHNTRNTGLANAVAAVEAGVSRLDASLGGFGGCPFAPKATGNIPTEDLVYMLHRMGYATGIDPEALIAAANWLGEELGHPPPGMLARAGMFPPVRAA